MIRTQAEWPDQLGALRDSGALHDRGGEHVHAGEATRYRASAGSGRALDLVSAWHMVTKNEPYQDLGAELIGLAERVMVATDERDAAAAKAEKRAGEAPYELTEVEALSLCEAVEGCGRTVTAREARRLRRLPVRIGAMARMAAMCRLWRPQRYGSECR